MYETKGILWSITSYLNRSALLTVSCSDLITSGFLKCFISLEMFFTLKFWCLIIFGTLMLSVHSVICNIPFIECLNKQLSIKHLMVWIDFDPSLQILPIFFPHFWSNPNEVNFLGNFSRFIGFLPHNCIFDILNCVILDHFYFIWQFVYYYKLFLVVYSSFFFRFRILEKQIQRNCYRGYCHKQKLLL